MSIFTNLLRFHLLKDIILQLTTKEDFTSNKRLRGLL